MATPLMHSDASIVEAFNEINSGELTNTIFANANVVMLSKQAYYELVEKTESKIVKIDSDSVLINKQHYTQLVEQIESLLQTIRNC